MMTNGIYSPMANLLTFEETTDGQMNVKMTQIQRDKMNTEYDIVQKLGEGSFGEAFKVRSRLDGGLYAIKKAKQKYIGFKDRDQKL